MRSEVERMSEEEKRTTKSVQVPTFNGKKSTFGVWWPRFRAYCTVRKIGRALYQTFKLPVDPKSEPADEAKKKEFQKILQDNNECVAGLTLAFTTPQLMELVVQSETDDYPEGITKDIVQKLFRKYRPTDTISSVEAESALIALKFKESAHPDHFFTKLSVLKSTYAGSKKFTEEALIPLILAKAPSKYSSALTSERRAKGSSLTLDDIQDTMVEQYRMENNSTSESGGGKSEGKEKGEVILAGADDETRTCFICHKKGHIAKHCPLKKQGGGKGKGRGKKVRFNGICNHCGKRGHKRENCWLLEENASQRPSGWKPPSDEETGGAGIEYCLMSSDAKMNESVDWEKVEAESTDEEAECG